MNVISSFDKELKTPDRFQPSANEMSVALSKTTKSASFPDDLDAMALPNSDSTNGTFIRIQIPAPPIAPEEALGSANIKSVGIIDISIMEEQIQSLENVVSSACNSLLMSKHHHKSEKKRKKEHKEHKQRDRNQEERKWRHKHKDKDKECYEE
jgi:hypothetical protein